MSQRNKRKSKKQSAARRNEEMDLHSINLNVTDSDSLTPNNCTDSVCHQMNSINGTKVLGNIGTHSRDGGRCSVLDRLTDCNDINCDTGLGHNGEKVPSSRPVQVSYYNITSLPDDILFVIFTFLNPKDLCKLSRVCKRFNYLSSKDCVWSYHVEQMVLVQFPIPSKRRTCSFKEKFRLAPNWRDGKFKDRLITRHKVKQIPWIQKDEKDIWFSSGNVIRCFKSQPNGNVKEDGNSRLYGLVDDATRFVVKNDIVVAGSSDGSIHGWHTSGKTLFYHRQVHQSDTHCVDFTGRCVVSGSKDGTCKIIPLQTTDCSGPLSIHSLNAGERVWCLQCSPCQSYFVAGLAGYLDDPPLIKWDIESGEFLGHLTLGSKSKRGAGVLHMKFESPNELLTCGYDTFMRLWDLRTNSCVVEWEEPYDSSLYCLDTDGANAIVVGTARHGMVRLWDKRKPDAVQMFYSTVCNSPVYSLAMDYGHLYLALDMGLNRMDFTG